MTPDSAGIDPSEFSPWPSRRLWSLWDMLRKLDNVVHIFARVRDLERKIDNIIETKGSDATTPPIPAGDPFLNGFKELGDTPALPSMTAGIMRIGSLYESGGTAAEFQAAIVAFRDRAEDELKAAHVFWLRNEFVRYYDALKLFGADVTDKFPAAIDDIEGAGRCLALEQGTATVLHLMRVMEVGLKALAKGLRIPYAPSWESYLKQIQARIDAKHKTKGIKWKRDEPFYRDVSGDLLTVKQAWRNPTMHVVRKYTPDEAEEIFRAVRTFMQKLARKLLGDPLKGPPF